MRVGGRLVALLVVLPSAQSAFAQLPRPHEGPCRAGGGAQQRQAARVAVPSAGLATEDLIPVIAAGVLTAAAGLLQYSVSADDKGISAYLGKEKGQNPFYNYRSSRPTTQGRPRPREEER